MRASGTQRWVMGVPRRRWPSISVEAGGSTQAVEEHEREHQAGKGEQASRDKPERATQVARRLDHGRGGGAPGLSAMAWRLQLEPCAEAGGAVAVEPRAPPEGARAQLGTATDPAVRLLPSVSIAGGLRLHRLRRGLSRLRACASGARSWMSSACCNPVSTRLPGWGGDAARRIGQCRAGAARSQLRPAPSRARLRARRRDALPPARPAPRHPRRRLPQRAATGPAEAGAAGSDDSVRCSA
jgi:hypothetical protein